MVNGSELLAGVAAATLLAQSAVAQSSPTPTTPVTPSASLSEPPAVSPSDTPATSAGITDIVVTARKRAERLQDVPVAVTALTGDQLNRLGAANLQDLHLGIPNVTITQNTGVPGAAMIYIRGIGQDDSTFTAEQGVALYVDGVIISRANGANLDLLDLDRIEVLRGPQGTLYGRSSTAGAIKLVTRRPDLAATHATVEATIGSYNRFDARASLSIPVVKDIFAVKIDVLRRSNDGYTKDISSVDRVDINNTDRFGGRISGLYSPNNDFSAYFAIDYSVDNSNIYQGTPVVIANNVATPFFGSPFLAQHSVPNIFDNHHGGGLLELSQKVGTATLKSITGYRAIREDLAQDLDSREDLHAIELQQHYENNQFSQELQLVSGAGSPLQYVLGLYYFNAVDRQFAQNYFQSTDNTNRQVTNSYDAFVEGTYKFLPTLSLTVGGRYTRDEKDITNHVVSRTSGLTLFDTQTPICFNNFSPRVILDWKATPDILLYASVSKGYKPGGYISGRPSSVSQAQAAFPPEKVTTYEAGAKLELFDHKARVNAAYFYNDYTRS